MRRILLAAGALALAGAPLAAQCTNIINPQAMSACQHAEDAVKTLHPLVGMIISGGDPVIGSGSTLGGFGHLFVSARVNAVKVALPSTNTADSASATGLVPAPVVDAGLGLFRGLGGGLLAVDALGSATLLPTGAVANLTVDSGASKIGSLALGLGYGARIGIIRGGFPLPSVSLSIMRRTLPRIRYGHLGATFASDSAFMFDTDLRATNIRLVAAMHILLLDVAAGVGLDQYTSTAHVSYYNSLASTTTDTIKLDNKRSVLFVDAGMNLLAVKLVGELGYQTGKDQDLTTTYQGFDPKAGHVFGGIGIRVSF